MRSKHRIGLALLAFALLSIGGQGPLPADKTIAQRPSCRGPADTAGLMGTDWTEQDKAGWLRDQYAAVQRCLDDRFVDPATAGY